MNYLYHRKFEKQLDKLSPQLQEKFYERLEIFLDNPFHPVLRNHVLHGAYQGLHCIDITGDIRAAYNFVAENLVQFTHIGTHHRLFGS